MKGKVNCYALPPGAYDPKFHTQGGDHKLTMLKKVSHFINQKILTGVQGESKTKI